MSVGPNPSGISPKIAPTPIRAVQANPGQSANAQAVNKNNLNPAAFRGAQAPGAHAQATANAFSATFLASTGAVAAGTNRKKSSDVSGDAKEGEGLVGLETESESQPDALEDKNQGEQGAGEINASGSASGPAT